MSGTGWKCEFRLVISSKDGVSLKDFNDSLDRFVVGMVDGIPDSGTAAPKSAIDGWSGGLDLPIADDNPEYIF